ncbi:Arginyl-tRNA--protein transferase 1 [Cadophora gregata]|uniref:Arginyl-tRNA--protein transferase 1 n=1 Tax=Cadophora gregata TaxID=51156 RepID=UPI0026DCE056|nr:Arginyl-tRNA--protein transferase 1 [Cadophora gregata]KAK0107280.1 Arginyl-tRNA--protein transferase 1 [Cadophora gregata]
MQSQAATLLSPIGYSNNRCGYCCNKSGSFSYYVTTTSLTAKFYQSLLDRGWRRSGTLLYKPDQSASCCPHYTIRLDSDQFHASKDQRQVQNRFNKYILGDTYIKEAARRHPLSREQAKKRNKDFNVAERVHECEKEQVKVPPEPAHTLTVTLEPDNFTEEKYILFENYQRVVHHEPPQKITKHGFKNFLCSSPLPRSEEVFDEGRVRRLGSYHQCYRIDGKLVAIGVLDLLPQCVSAVYFMYHESVHEHGFGKLGAMREIVLAKEQGYRWWYAGFYIHSCIKMRYKGDFSPQYMLDPDSYAWDPLDTELKKKLDKTKFFSLSRERSGLVEDLSNTTKQPPHITDTPNEANMVDDSDEDDPPLSDPDTPLFARSIPGILTIDQLQHQVDLDSINIQVRGLRAEAQQLLCWDTSDINSSSSIKCIIAELAAAVGPSLAKEMVVSFR